MYSPWPRRTAREKGQSKGPRVTSFTCGANGAGQPRDDAVATGGRATAGRLAYGIDGATDGVLAGSQVIER
jgi:hypothetical protein